GLSIGPPVNRNNVIALADQLVAEVITVLVIAPRLHDLAPLTRFLDIKLVPIALLPGQVVQDKREAVARNPLDGDPAHPPAKAELVRRDHHLHSALDGLAPGFFAQRVQEPDRSREE